MKRLARWLRSVVFAVVDLGGRRPWLVMTCAVVAVAAAWAYATKLEIRSDLREMLPRDSPGFQAFERRIERIGGRATILVLVESPDRGANERFIDALRASVEGMEHRDLVAWVESDTKEVRSFFEANKWLYADVKDLEDADDDVDRQIAIRSGMVEDLLDEDTQAKDALGIDDFDRRFRKKADEHDDFPTGYFASADGTQLAMRIFSTTAGLGGSRDLELYDEVRAIARGLHPEQFQPQMKVGFGGDIPNTVAEKDALLEAALLATGIAAALILGGVMWFYGSPWSLVLIGFPPLCGIGCAYAFATHHYGYVNSAGAFLGAIILGNGINYPIVLYSRYKEFRARGMVPDVARREAVWNAFRAELVGASVASIAYGSLSVTRFRGFSQFGVIGFVGMLLVWSSMIVCLPALIVLLERLQARLPPWMRERPAKLGTDESRGPIARLVGNVTARRPRVFVSIAAVLTVAAAWKLPAYLVDPWEYDFDKLGSEHARENGTYRVSEKVDRILSGKMNMNGSLVLADTPEEVPVVKERILANDAADPDGSLIQEITTVSDFLPGAPDEQRRKLEILARFRERFTPAVMARLSPAEREKVERSMPPESLRVLAPTDLPDMLKRRFSESNGTLGTVFYVRYRPDVPRNDGHVLLRQAATIDEVVLPDGKRVETSSRATVFAEMIRSLVHDGPLVTAVSFAAVCIVVLVATSSKRGAFAVLLSLVLGVVWMLGAAALQHERLNFLNFIALPITFGIGSEYPFNIFDRSRLLGGDVTRAVKLHLGAVTLCSYTTTIGYGSLLFAENQALRSFGRLAIGGEIACLTVAALFLPSLLHLLGAHAPSRRMERSMYERTAPT